MLLLWLSFTFALVAGAEDLLWKAAYTANVVAVHSLLTHNRSAVDLAYIDPFNGRSALMICGFDPQNMQTLDADCSSIASLMLDAGMDMERVLAVDYRGWSALSLGALRGLTLYCQTLMNAASNAVYDPEVFTLSRTEIVHGMLNVQESHGGRTALMLAAQNGHFQTAIALLEQSFELNDSPQDTEQGGSSTIDAAGSSVIHGTVCVNVSKVTGEGQTALHLATARAVTNATAGNIDKFRRIVSLMRERDCTACGVPLGTGSQACDDANSRGVSILNAVDSRNRTALMYASMGLNHAVAAVLVDAGADVSLLDSNGRTAIEMAASSPALLELLGEALVARAMKQHGEWQASTDVVLEGGKDDQAAAAGGGEKKKRRRVKKEMRESLGNPAAEAKNPEL